MSEIRLALGPVVFRNFELPTEITFGGRQRLAVHRLADGRRVVDCLGRDEGQIVFSGIFSGVGAGTRARMLDQFRGQGVELPLSWDGFFYSVLIQDFTALYQNEAWIPYCIKCVVIRDESLSVSEPAIILANLLSSDLGSAITVDTAGNLDFSGLSSAVSAFANAGAGTESLRAVSSELLHVQAGARAEIAVVEQQLPSSTLEEVSVADAPMVMSKATDAVEQISRLRIINAYLGRASVNVSNQLGAA